jgi:hypothetical protein
MQNSALEIYIDRCLKLSTTMPLCHGDLQDQRSEVRTGHEHIVEPSTFAGSQPTVCQGDSCTGGAHFGARELLDQRAPAKARRAGDDSRPDMLVGQRLEVLVLFLVLLNLRWDC